MKKKIIIILSVIFIITILSLAQAGILSDMFNSIKSQISSEDKQVLRDVINNSNLEKVDITYSFTDDEIKWGAYVPNVMNTQDNVLQRYWMNCTVKNETTGACETEVRIEYTKQESADMISTIIANKLSAYAQSIGEEIEFSIPEIEVVDLN